MRQDDLMSFDATKVMNFSKVPFTSVKQLDYEQSKTNYVSFGRSHSVSELSCVLIIKKSEKTERNGAYSSESPRSPTTSKFETSNQDSSVAQRKNC
ncbi:hypothetical protein PoB_003608800 [Plakobranchus ocellatus]|uniref:Uncharacterized protein n=1 Tax=Plakobranchus ocellatus TaxID=259542 RepID=A0AAV4ASN5_9GAST|nr:hypothetical protein PoB_003608800 [Plakobranchus ocellatus]